MTEVTRTVLAGMVQVPKNAAIPVRSGPARVLRSKLAVSVLFRFALLVAISAAFDAAAYGRAADGSRLVRNLRAGKRQTVVAYGTSLTADAAWVTQLRAALDRNWPGLATVINLGWPKTSSKWGVLHVDAVLAKKPDAVFIEFAINDAARESGISPEQARRNLATMVDRILAAKPDTEVIVMTMNGAVGIPRAARPDLATYYEMYRKLAADRGLMLIDHFAKWEELRTKNPALFRTYLVDGIHPNETGCREIITPTLLEAMGVPVVPVESVSAD